MKTLIHASVLALALAGAGAAHADYSYTINFDSLSAGANANLDPTALANGVSFASGQLAADLDKDGNPILDIYGQFLPGLTHWEAIAGTPMLVQNPSLNDRGTTTSGSLALDARYDQVLMQFAAPVQMKSFSFTLDNSPYGDLFPTQVMFLDAHGKTIATSQDFTGSGTSSLSYSFTTPTSVSAVLVPSTSKFYDDVSVSAVPEPASISMMIGGLAVVLATARRRRAVR